MALLPDRDAAQQPRRVPAGREYARNIRSNAAHFQVYDTEDIYCRAAFKLFMQGVTRSGGGVVRRAKPGRTARRGHSISP